MAPEIENGSGGTEQRRVVFLLYQSFFIRELEVQTDKDKKGDS